jgi:hypothetical protein
MADGRTIFQAQPFSVCEGGYATNGVRKVDASKLLRTDDVDIYSDGYYGMHGGSGLSTIGGAIRNGELSPGSGPIRHVLKIAFPGKHYLYFDDKNNKGYRWPARKHDTNAEGIYLGNNPEAQIGCLRAIPADVDLGSLGLETEPGRKIAWTLQNYGAYQCEGVPWARCMIAVEEGSGGCFPDVFKKEWGYAFVTRNKSGNPWFRDMVKIFAQLHIVANNGPNSIGGGGTPLQPLAPPFKNQVTSAHPAVSGHAIAPADGRPAAHHRYNVAGRRIRTSSFPAGIHLGIGDGVKNFNLRSCR